jgi:ubiquinone/menaquinone biosynthesis C-methylase UbiE
MDDVRVRGDYDDYAPTYAWARSTVSWVLDPLVAEATTLRPGSVALEVGCGTGNYARALESIVPAVELIGLDVSEPMLREARASTTRVSLVRADASRAIPLADRTVALTFAVDVIHHLADLEGFFLEAARVLEEAGRLTIVTDTPENLPHRSMPKFFPEVIDLELDRLPSMERMDGASKAAGLDLLLHETVAGVIELTDTFLSQLQAKCSSALRTLTPAAHAAGMGRVRAARARGERWQSSYSVFHYARSSTASNR